jgi:hypothetical protein
VLFRVIRVRVAQRHGPCDPCYSLVRASNEDVDGPSFATRMNASYKGAANGLSSADATGAPACAPTA